jgi:hypothetical protein
MELVRQIESYGSSPAGKVSRRVEIADCGQLLDRERECKLLIPIF